MQNPDKLERMRRRGYRKDWPVIRRYEKLQGPRADIENSPLKLSQTAKYATTNDQPHPLLENCDCLLGI